MLHFSARSPFKLTRHGPIITVQNNPKTFHPLLYNDATNRMGASKSQTFSNTFPVTLEYFENSSRVSLMAAMASMMLKSAALPTCRATQRSSMGGFGAERGVPNKQRSFSFYFGNAHTNSNQKLRGSSPSKKGMYLSQMPEFLGVKKTYDVDFSNPYIIGFVQVSTKFGDVFAFSGQAVKI